MVTTISLFSKLLKLKKINESTLILYIIIYKVYFIFNRKQINLSLLFLFLRETSLTIELKFDYN